MKLVLEKLNDWILIGPGADERFNKRKNNEKFVGTVGLIIRKQTNYLKGTYS